MRRLAALVGLSLVLLLPHGTDAEEGAVQVLLIQTSWWDWFSVPRAIALIWASVGFAALKAVGIHGKD